MPRPLSKKAKGNIKPSALSALLLSTQWKISAVIVGGAQYRSISQVITCRIES
jgi:hypothetical protein